VKPYTQPGASTDATVRAPEQIRKDLDRQRLRDQLLAGAASPATDKADAAYFDRLRGQVREAARR